MAARRIATLVAGVCVLLLLAVPASAAPPPPPLVTNGDFEATGLAPWVWYAGMVRLAGQADWTAAGGKQSVEVFNSGLLYQDVATTSGQRYDLSFAYAGNPGCALQGDKHLDVSWNGNLIGTGAGRATLTFDTTGHTAASMGWQTAHLLVDAASASTRISFGDSKDFDCGIALDDVAMTTPLPAQTGTQITAQNPYTVTGQPLTVTATVLGASAAVTPTGSVEFEVDGAPAGAAVALSSGQAQATFSDLARGAHAVTALYTPNSGSFSASAVTQDFSVLRASTATDLSVSTSRAPLGQDVTLTADVGVFAPGSGTPTGSVQFSDEFGALGAPVDLGADGLAQIAVTEDVGGHSLYASYSGDGDFDASYGYAPLEVYDPSPPPPVTSTTGRVGTATTLVSSRNPVAPGESFTVTATVSATAASNALLDGSVTFTMGTTVGTPVPLDAAHSASTTLTAPATRQSIRARYSGNPNFLGSTGFITETILAPPAPVSQPAPDRTPPIVHLTATPVRLGIALRRGIRVHVDCNENCSAALKLSLSARRARAFGMHPHGASVVVARGGHDFPDDRAYKAVVRFSPRARKALAKARRVVLRLTTVGSDLAGNDSVHVQMLALTR
jgi:hypothetical protein